MCVSGKPKIALCVCLSFSCSQIPLLCIVKLCDIATLEIILTGLNEVRYRGSPLSRNLALDDDDDGALIRAFNGFLGLAFIVRTSK